MNRFREERTRLGIKQKAVQDACGVAKTTVYRWEQGGAIPSDNLASLARIGFDAQYIVTGVRSENLREIREAGATYSVGDDYTEDEIELLRWYRALPKDEQERAFTLVRALGQAAGLTPTEVKRRARAGGQTVVGDGNVVTGGSIVAGRDISVSGDDKARKKKRRK